MTPGWLLAQPPGAQTLTRPSLFPLDVIRLVRCFCPLPCGMEITLRPCDIRAFRYVATLVGPIYRPCRLVPWRHIALSVCRRRHMRGSGGSRTSFYVAWSGMTFHMCRGCHMFRLCSSRVSFHAAASMRRSSRNARNNCLACGRFIRSASPACPYNTGTAEHARFRRGCNSRFPVVHSGPLPWVKSCRTLIVQLYISGRGMPFTGHRQLCSSGADGYAATTAIVAYATSGNGAAYGLVINVRNVRDVDVIDGPVVIERAVVPIATVVAVSSVAESIVDAAIKANRQSPIAGIPDIYTITPTPISRSP